MDHLHSHPQTEAEFIPCICGCGKGCDGDGGEGGTGIKGRDGGATPRSNPDRREASGVETTSFEHA